MDFDLLKKEKSPLETAGRTGKLKTRSRALWASRWLGAPLQVPGGTCAEGESRCLAWVTCPPLALEAGGHVR